MLEQLLKEKEIQDLLEYKCTKIPADLIQNQDNVEAKIQYFKNKEVSNQVINNLRRILFSGELAGSGYLSILAVDQGVEHSAMYSFLSNPSMFDPEKVLEFACHAGFSGIAAPYGILSNVARKFCDKIPMILKINHNELLSLPTKWKQDLFATVKSAWNLGCVGVGFTVYFGSEESRSEIQQIIEVIHQAREYGLLVFCWCYPRNKRFQLESVNLEEADDITSQAVYLGSTLGADFVKQKLPKISRGMRILKSEGYEVKVSKEMNEFELTHPIEMVRLQVLHAYSGKVGLLNSGGESLGDEDIKELVKTSIINKRAGGTGLMVGRKIFKRSFTDGRKLVSLLHGIYLNKDIQLA